MGILRDFDPETDGFSFYNFDTATVDWDVYRRAFLAIWPTKDVVAAPLDVAFYSTVVEASAAPGHCAGLSTLALAIWQLGGWFGFSSPTSFYEGLPEPAGGPHPGPSRDDLRTALHILHARQFGAGNVQDVLQTVKAGHLNDGGATFDRVVDGLASGDLQLISIADGLQDGHAHVLLPYAYETLADGTRHIWVWDSVHPYAMDDAYYTGGWNRIVIRSSSPTDWEYDQRAGTLYANSTDYKGSNLGWLFAFSSMAVRNKASQPFSVGYALSDLSFLVLTGSASVAQIEDDEGRRLFVTDPSGRRASFETAEDRLLAVAPWPWAGGPGSGSELYLVHGETGPLTVHVEGGEYRLTVAAPGRLTEITPQGPARATDSIRVESGAAGRAFEVRSSEPDRRFDLRHVRQPVPGQWDGVHVRDAHVTDDAVRIVVPADGDTVHVSAGQARRVDVEFQRFRDGALWSSAPAGGGLDQDRPLVAAPEQWTTAGPAAQVEG